MQRANERLRQAGRQPRWTSLLPAALFLCVMLVLGVLLRLSWLDASRDNMLRRANAERIERLQETEIAFFRDAFQHRNQGAPDDGGLMDGAAAGPKAYWALIDSIELPPIESAVRPYYDELRRIANALRSIDASEGAADFRGATSAMRRDLSDRFVSILSRTQEAERRLALSLQSAAAEGRAHFYRLLTAFAATTAMMLVVLTVGSYRYASAQARVAMLGDVAAERDRADLIAGEMRHRLQNVFAVTSSIVSQTGRHEADARVASEKARARIAALARAHQAGLDAPEGGPVDLGHLIEAICGPYAPRPDRLILDIQDETLGPDLATPISLILNELCTNAIKYGAWASEGGVAITVQTMSPADRRLVWTECAAGPKTAAPDTGAAGFGTRLIEALAAQHGISVRRDWGDGLRVTLGLPAGRAVPPSAA